MCAGAGRVLELGAGTGRLTVPLARDLASRVDGAMFGLEPSAAMLARARERAHEAGVTVTWVAGDMRDFALDPGVGFDRIIVPFNGFLHLHTRADHHAFFTCVRRHLAPGGRLALSIVSPDPETLGRHPGHRLRLHHHDIIDPATGQPILIEETVRWDHATQRTRGRFHVSWPDWPDRIVVPVDLRMVFPRELELLLEHEGFVMDAWHGDYDDHPFDSLSLLQNVVCRLA